MPNVLELACLVIVLLYVVTRHVRLRSWMERRRFLVRFFAIAIAGFIGEDSMIAAYGTYTYSEAAWSTFLDHRVPLVIVLVWPVVIDSAMLLARAIVTPTPARLPLVTALIVLADASLIEPIAVRARLWWWTEPAGIFAVPVIGILGWAFFAFFATLLIERGRSLVLLIIGAPLLTHASVLASWWILFRWVLRGSIDSKILIGGAFAVMIPTAIVLRRLTTRRANIPIAAVLERAPGALFFFALLATRIAPPTTDLLIYATVFALPYVSLLVKERGRPQVAEITSNR